MSMTRRPAPVSRLCLAAMILCAALLAGCGSGGGSSSAGTFPLTGTAPGPRAGELTYVALGASDAFGVGTSDPDRQNWPNDLTDELGPNVHLINLGLPGATLAQATRDELPIALEAHPDLVTIWLAVNDFAANLDLATYRQQLTDLLATLRARTHAHVYVANLPNLSLVPYFSAEDSPDFRARVQAWNAAIATACAGAGANLVNLAAGWEDLANNQDYISDDGLHPSTIGALAIAHTFAAAIRQTSALP